MNNELSNAIETISTCAESVSELSTALDKYLSSFERIQKTVSDIQKHEESTADILDTVSLQISEQIEKTQNWAEEVVPEAVRTLTDLSARTVELTEGTGKELEKSLSILTSAVDELGPIVKEMDGISAALHSVSEKAAELELLVDVRLNNRSQLAGFTKGNDLEYFLQKLCRTEYIHCDEFAPTKDLLGRYQKGVTSWEEYETEFHEIMERRGAYKKFLNRFRNFNKVCLLCSEPTPNHCHRRLVAEKIKSTDEKSVEIIHL